MSLLCALKNADEHPIGNAVENGKATFDFPLFTFHCDSDTPGRRHYSLYRTAYRIRDRGDSLDGDAFATGEAMDVAMWDEDRCEAEL